MIKKTIYIFILIFSLYANFKLSQKIVYHQNEKADLLTELTEWEELAQRCVCLERAENEIK